MHQYEENQKFVETLLSAREANSEVSSHVSLPSSERGDESESSKDQCEENEGFTVKDEKIIKEKMERRRMTLAFTKQIYEVAVNTPPPQPRMEPEASTVPTGRRRRASEGNKREAIAKKENSPQKNVAIQRISTQLLNNFEHNFQWDRDQEIVMNNAEGKQPTLSDRLSIVRET